MGWLEAVRTFLHGPRPSNFVRVPLTGKGALFVSPMPFGPYDQGNSLLKEYRQNKIEAVLALVTDDEVSRKGRTDLWARYAKERLEVVRVPFADYTAPTMDQVNAAVPKLLKVLDHGGRLVIHCNAGVGRTGILTACICARRLGLSGPEAVAYITEHMMVRLTDEQQRFVHRFAEGFPGN